MKKRWNRLETWLALIAVGAGVLVTALAGLFAYISITTKPLHPDAQNVPSVTSPLKSSQWAEAAAGAHQAVRASLVEQNLPGLSVAVGTGGDVVWAEAFGYADLEKRLPVTPEMRFRIGNVSNTITSAAVGLLVEKHALNIEDEIQAYVPEFPRKQWSVTVRQLMAHQAGIRNDEGDEEPLSARCERTVDGIDRFARSALLFEPGTRFHPSSYGWILVSAAVEAAARQPFFTFVRTQIFERLGMDRTRPDKWDEQIADRVTFYFPRFAGDTKYGPELAREGDHSCFAGAGAFLSTPSDLVRFGMAVEGGQLLQPSTVEMLQAPQRLESGQETAYGLGWNVETTTLAGKPARLVSHGTKEDFIGGTATLATFHEPGLTVAVTTNISFADTKSIALRVAEIFARVTAPNRAHSTSTSSRTSSALAWSRGRTHS